MAKKLTPNKKKKSTLIKKQPRSTPKDREYVYLIHEREFLNAKKPVYKLGKTTQWNCRRLQDYPKNSALILVWRVPNCHIVERELIREFDKRYKKRQDIGAEYYQGDVNKMKTTFINVVKMYPDDPLNPGWGRWLWNGLKNMAWK
jgi:hypothetical protein